MSTHQDPLATDISPAQESMRQPNPLVPLVLLPREDNRLTERSRFVPPFADPEFQAFLDNLIKCGEDNMGVGIAAPQVGKSWRVFIMSPKASLRYPNSPTLDPFPVIDPKIARLRGEVVKDWEGCLSVPGYRGLVPRYTEVEVEYFDRLGNMRHTAFSGFLARIFQHEFDHLEGILYTSRMEKGDALLTMEEYAALTGNPAPVK